MYLSYYHLTDKPFQISTDTRFLWLSENHKEALDNLKYGLLQNNGFVVLTGAVGTGKTTLVNALLETLNESVLVATINHPTLETLDFLRLIAKSYDPQATTDNKADLLLFFKAFLRESYERGRTVLLVVDEAHRLSDALLEEVRLLSNMEQNGQRLLNIFFVGQSELNTTLLSPHCTALRQRITLYYELEPFTEIQTAHYVQHRLRIAGSEQPLFTPEALKAVHRFSGGYPRAINILCDRALLTGYVKEHSDIDEAVIAECIAEISIRPTKHRRPAYSPPISDSIATGLNAGTARTMDMVRDAAHTTSHYIATTPRRWVLPLVLASIPVIAAVLLFFGIRSSSNPAPVVAPAPEPAIEERAAAATSPAVNNEPQPPAPPNREPALQPVKTPAPDYTALAETAIAERKYQAALELIESAQKNRTTTARTATLYSQALVGRAQEVATQSPDQARGMLERAIAAYPANALAYFELGKLYSRGQDYPRAIDAYQNVLRLDPTLPEAYFNLGFLFATTGQYESAERMFARVVQMKPDYLDKALFNLAIVQRKRGKNRESVANLEEALAIRPDNQRVQAYLDQFKATLNN
ncbi:MAG: AAA family ATPase [Desulfatitalea sp.]|nr:AAA family ATPase [Desulfatitalea sp.]